MLLHALDCHEVEEELAVGVLLMEWEKERERKKEAMMLFVCLRSKRKPRPCLWMCAVVVGIDINLRRLLFACNDGRKGSCTDSQENQKNEPTRRGLEIVLDPVSRLYLFCCFLEGSPNHNSSSESAPSCGCPWVKRHSRTLPHHNMKWGNAWIDPTGIIPTYLSS